MDSIDTQAGEAASTSTSTLTSISNPTEIGVLENVPVTRSDTADSGNTVNTAPVHTDAVAAIEKDTRKQAKPEANDEQQFTRTAHVNMEVNGHDHDKACVSKDKSANRVTFAATAGAGSGSGAGATQNENEDFKDGTEQGPRRVLHFPSPDSHKQQQQEKQQQQQQQQQVYPHHPTHAAHSHLVHPAAATQYSMYNHAMMSHHYHQRFHPQFAPPQQNPQQFYHPGMPPPQSSPSKFYQQQQHHQHYNMMMRFNPNHSTASTTAATTTTVNKDADANNISSEINQNQGDVSRQQQLHSQHSQFDPTPMQQQQQQQPSLQKDENVHPNPHSNNSNEGDHHHHTIKTEVQYSLSPSVQGASPSFDQRLHISTPAGSSTRQSQTHMMPKLPPPSMREDDNTDHQHHHNIKNEYNHHFDSIPNTATSANNLPPQPSPLERFHYDHHFQFDRNHNMAGSSSGFPHSAGKEGTMSAGMGFGGISIMTPCSINMTPASNASLGGLDSAGFVEEAKRSFISPGVTMSKRGNSKR